MCRDLPRNGCMMQTKDARRIYVCLAFHCWLFSGTWRVTHDNGYCTPLSEFCQTQQRIRPHDILIRDRARRRLWGLAELNRNRAADRSRLAMCELLFQRSCLHYVMARSNPHLGSKSKNQGARTSPWNPPLPIAFIVLLLTCYLR